MRHWTLASVCFIALAAHAAGSIKDRLKSYQGVQGKDHESAVIEASNMINRLPRNMEGRWDRKQIATIVDLLQTEKDAVYRQQLIERAVVHFEDNRKAIGQFIDSDKKISAQDKKDLLYDLDVTIDAHNRGQDPPRSKYN